MSLPTGTLQSKWLSKYGPTLRMTSVFRRPEVMTTDAQALNHIYSHPELFGRLDSSRKNSLAMTGKSLLWVEDDDHKRLRRTMVPTFAPAQMKQLVSAFLDKSYELKEKLLAEVEESKGRDVDMANWAGRVTVDIIGMAGFDYNFESIQKEGNALLEAWNKSLAAAAAHGTGLLSILQFTGISLPSNRFFVSRLANAE